MEPQAGSQITRGAASRRAVIAALAACASGWGCGESTASPPTPNECRADAACEVDVTPGCVADAACDSSASCADGGCVDGPRTDDAGLTIVDGSGLPSSECDGGECGSGSVCVNGNCSTQFYLVAMPPVASPTLSIAGALFSVSDILTSDSASALTVVLDWGDGTTSSGAVAGSAGSFTVSGSHTYPALGGYAVTATLRSAADDGPVTATINVSVGLTVFPVPEAGSSIILGPDGNLWFTMPNANQIGRMTTAGLVTTFAIPTPNAGTTTIAPGPDGNLWFIENATNKIASITPLGVISEYDIPTSGSQPSGITAGPDGNLWFTESFGDKIGRISPTGTNTAEFSIPIAGAAPVAIVPGPDGNLWFTLLNTGAQTSAIGTITPAGTIRVIKIPTGDGPSNIVTGPDGNVWYANVGAPSLGRVTPSGVVGEVPIGTYSTALAVGPDGNFWFVGGNYGGDTTNFGKVTPAGVTTAYMLPSRPMGVTPDLDGHLWVSADKSILMMVAP